MPPLPRILIVVRGGVVQEVCADRAMAVTIAEYDDGAIYEPAPELLSPAQMTAGLASHHAAVETFKEDADA